MNITKEQAILGSKLLYHCIAYSEDITLTADQTVEMLDLKLKLEKEAKKCN